MNQQVSDPLNEPESLAKPRSQPRQLIALIVIGAATAQALGLTLKMPTQLEANDISRWCTVWSLLERGSYAIDECPWQARTQDKVRKPAPFASGRKDIAVLAESTPIDSSAGHSSSSSPVEEPPMHFYSSKPPLLPTIIAGILYPVRALTGVPLDATVPQERIERNVQKEKPGAPGEFIFEVQKPEPVKWPVYVLYLKPTIVLLNVVPMFVFLVLFTRLLDRYAENDWAWFLSLFAAAWGTQLLVFEQTLNNHTVAAYSAFFAVYALVKIWNEDNRSPWVFAASGFFGAFCATNELPAALFGIALFLMLLVKAPKQTLLYFVPAAAIPCAGYLVTQYLAMGGFRPAYEEFGSKPYNYYGSYWNTPLEMDYLNKEPEPRAMYLFNMILGHHGVLSLTPIFFFSFYAIFMHLIGRMRKLTALAWLSAFLTVAMVAFYTWNPKARNYGGSTQGMRWLFWLFPFWLVFLPAGLAAGQDRKWVRWLSLAALCVSVFSVGYALRTPWSHPWVIDVLEHLDLYTLVR